jgi:hypothetical protein
VGGGVGVASTVAASLVGAAVGEGVAVGRAVGTTTTAAGAQAVRSNNVSMSDSFAAFNRDFRRPSCVIVIA